MTAPRISVVIDTYNYGRFVTHAIESALEQDFPREQIEILVVDDGSTDDTAKCVAKYGDRVRYLWKENGGQASAINFGAAHAKGGFVAFLDGDDVWMPDKLSRVMKEFDDDARVVMAYHKYCFWDASEERTWEPTYFNEVAGDVVADSRKVVRYIAAPTSSLVFQRAALQRLMPIPEECSFMWDAYAVSTVIFLGPVACVSDCLTRNRVHGQNLWFVGSHPEPAALRRRVKAREAAIASIRKWVAENGPESSRPQARILLEAWRTIQEDDEFQLEPPGRIKFFRYQLRKNRLHKGVNGRKLRTVNFLNAYASLLTGYEGFGALDAWWLKVDKGKDGLLSLLTRQSKRRAGEFK